MKILLDEQNLLDKALESGYISNKPTDTFKVLIKYYFGKGKDKTEVKKSEVKKSMIEFLKKVNKDFYNPVKWDKTISNMITSIHKYESKKEKDKFKLHSIKKITLSKRELNVIKSLDDIEYEKYAFTVLVYAKIKNMMNPLNDSWIEKDKDLFDDAKLSKDIKREKKYSIVHELNNRGLTEEAKKVNSTTLRVSFVDPTGEPELEITDFDDFVYDYLKWRGEKNIGVCLCEKLFERVTNNQKYCKECAVRINREKTKQKMKNSRMMFDSEKA